MINWDDTSTWRVLTVDDEPDNLEVVAETLEFLGATVRTAPNGIKAIEALQSFEANLILLDLSMPVMNGWEARMKIRSNPATSMIPIMALSAHAMIGDKERAIAAGFDGYLTKPIDVRSIQTEIQKAGHAITDHSKSAPEEK